MAFDENGSYYGSDEYFSAADKPMPMEKRGVMAGSNFLSSQPGVYRGGKLQQSAPPPRPPVTPINVAPRPIAAPELPMQQNPNVIRGSSGSNPSSPMNERAAAFRSNMTRATTRNSTEIRAYQAADLAAKQSAEQAEIKRKGIEDAAMQFKYLQAKYGDPARVKAAVTVKAAELKAQTAEKNRTSRETIAANVQTAADKRLADQGLKVGDPAWEKKHSEARADELAKLQNEQEFKEKNATTENERQTARDTQLNIYKMMEQEQGQKNKMSELEATGKTMPTLEQQKKIRETSVSRYNQFKNQDNFMAQWKKSNPNATPDEIIQAEKVWKKTETIAKKTESQEKAEWLAEAGLKE